MKGARALPACDAQSTSGDGMMPKNRVAPAASEADTRITMHRVPVGATTSLSGAGGGSSSASGDPPAIAEWRRRMGSDHAKAIYKQRAATAELVNAQARNRGLVRLLVRGVEKVKAVLLWHALAHNMARLWSLAPT